MIIAQSNEKKDTEAVHRHALVPGFCRRRYGDDVNLPSQFDLDATRPIGVLGAGLTVHHIGYSLGYPMVGVQTIPYLFRYLFQCFDILKYQRPPIAA